MSFPRGWNSKVGVALKIGVVVVAAASDAGEVADLPAPCPAAVAAWGGENGGARSSTERQGDLVNAAFDGLAGAVPDKWNDLVDSAFMGAESEVGCQLTQPAVVHDVSYMLRRAKHHGRVLM